MNVFITGSSGFVGKPLSELLHSKNYQCTLSQRNVCEKTTDASNLRYLQKSISANTSWENNLKGIDCVIHTAALVHQKPGLSESCYREINTYGTINLAQQAAYEGVKRFIFISSIKVNGNSTEVGSPFKYNDTFIPTEPYALSKYEAEVGLRKIAKETGMEVVIIRPPLVYGPGVKANFASMMKWVNKGLPLPLGNIKKNKRSLVSVDNLVDLIIICLEHPLAANETFLVSDKTDISTSQLLKNMASALGVSSRLLKVPSLWLTLIANLVGKPAVAHNLCGSLQVDISKTQELLDWEPKYDRDECMQKTADAFLDNLSEKK